MNSAALLQRPPTPARAFTLVELLVVIVLVGVLISLVTSVTSHARLNSQNAKCIDHLRKIGTSVLAYTADHGGAFIVAAVPAEKHFWFHELNEYLGGTYDDRPDWLLCPSKKFEQLTYETSGYGWNYMNFGYKPTHPLAGWGSKITQVSIPSRTIIIGDSTDAVGSWETNYKHRYLYSTKGTESDWAKRHMGKGNYFFLDGHIEAITPDDLQLRPSLWQKVKNL